MAASLWSFLFSFTGITASHVDMHKIALKSTVAQAKLLLTLLNNRCISKSNKIHSWNGVFGDYTVKNPPVQTCSWSKNTKKRSFAAAFGLDCYCTVLKEMNITLQCVTCPVRPASSQGDAPPPSPSPSPPPSPHMWPLILNTDPACAGWVCLWLRHTSRWSCKVQ